MRPSAQRAILILLWRSQGVNVGCRLGWGFVIVGMEFSSATETPLLLTGKQCSHLCVPGSRFNSRQSQGTRTALSRPRKWKLPEADFPRLPKEGLEQRCFGISSRCSQLPRPFHGKVLSEYRECVCVSGRGRLGSGNHLDPRGPHYARGYSAHRHQVPAERGRAGRLPRSAALCPDPWVADT